MFFNYKQFYSIVLQALVDHQYRFTAIEVGSYGKSSDSGIFLQSQLNQALQQCDFIPPPRALPGSNVITSTVILGDEAYPLQKHLLRPYSRRQLNNQRTIFNYRLSRARKVVECAFGIICQKWRLLLKSIEAPPTKAELYVKTVCLLHNICIDKKQEPELMDVPHLTTPPQQGTHIQGRGAIQFAQANRECFTRFFSSPEGAIPQQYRL